MRYFLLHPEVAGGLGERSVVSRDRHPPTVSRLHYEMDVWLGDELLEGFPCFIVTAGLAKAIANSGLSGASFETVELSLSEQFHELYPDRGIPHFVWLQVTGMPEQHDFGTDSTGRLVVSETALRVLKAATLGHCEIAEIHETK